MHLEELGFIFRTEVHVDWVMRMILGSLEDHAGFRQTSIRSLQLYLGVGDMFF